RPDDPRQSPDRARPPLHARGSGAAVDARPRPRFAIRAQRACGRAYARMIAILGGLGAAVAWTVAIVCSSRSSRVIGPAAVVAWVMLVGLVITAPLAAATGIPHGLYGRPALWLALSAGGNVAGLLLVYGAIRV